MGAATCGACGTAVQVINVAKPWTCPTCHRVHPPGGIVGGLQQAQRIGCLILCVIGAAVILAVTVIAIVQG